MKLKVLKEANYGIDNKYKFVDFVNRLCGKYTLEKILSGDPITQRALFYMNRKGLGSQKDGSNSSAHHIGLHFGNDSYVVISGDDKSHRELDKIWRSAIKDVLLGKYKDIIENAYEEYSKEYDKTENLPDDWQINGRIDALKNAIAMVQKGLQNRTSLSNVADEINASLDKANADNGIDKLDKLRERDVKRVQSTKQKLPSQQEIIKWILSNEQLLATFENKFGVKLK